MTESSDHAENEVAVGKLPAEDPQEPNMWAFIIPFVAFMAIGMLYPKFDQVFRDSVDPTVVVEGDAEQVLEVNPEKTNRYMGLIGLQVVVAAGILFYFRRTYLEQFPLKFNWISVPIGVIGVVLWIGICNLNFERAILEPLGMTKYVEIRPSFNPFQQLQNPMLLSLFLALRFFLLAVLVPIVEELFLRGWLIRYFENPKWWIVSLSELSFNSLAIATVYGVLAHPGEAFAAIAWFSLISWMMVRTGNLWDCVVAHGITNLLLGIYIVWFGAWHLW